jgi:molecular chaperone DnaK
VSIHVLQGEREMAAQNRTLGRFDLVGIPPAPRGVPQIEVTFDIDANGIVHVSAKDLGTGKEQKIRIESSSGLNQDDIKKMVRDAEAHSSEDKKARELAEARNEADNLLYSTEKSLRDYGAKISDADRKGIEAASAELRKALDSQNAAEIKSKSEALKQAAYKLAEEVYRGSGAKGQGGAGGGAAGSGGQGPRPEGAGPAGETVEDADYEVVDDDGKKK